MSSTGVLVLSLGIAAVVINVGIAWLILRKPRAKEEPDADSAEDKS